MAADKKLMMKKAGRFCEGGFSVGLRVLKGAILAAVLAMTFAVSAHAVSDNVKKLQFINHQGHHFSASYNLVRDAMRSTYKVTDDTNPLIGIAESDLNVDKYPEIIAYPLEDFEGEDGLFCTENGLCPHYILEVREKSVHTLGVIFADSVDMGTEIKNGYWTLKAFKKERAGSNDFETYVYDKAQDIYVFESETKAGPSPPKQ